jgi:hypothetical protein
LAGLRTGSARRPISPARQNAITLTVSSHDSVPPKKEKYFETVFRFLSRYLVKVENEPSRRTGTGAVLGGCPATAIMNLYYD